MDNLSRADALLRKQIPGSALRAAPE